MTDMSHDTALLDANILYPAMMRDIFVQLANDELFQARWTADIHREWIEALLKNKPHFERTALELPDPNDRHVLAAAIVGRCDVIVSQNLRHFPEDALAPYGIEVQHPDDFLVNHLNLFREEFCTAIRISALAAKESALQR